MSDLVDYACPECGYDGPHPVLQEIKGEGESPVYLVECGDSACAIEFELEPAP